MNTSDIFRPGMLLAITFGVILGGVVTLTLHPESHYHAEVNKESREPLYWQAPMDPNYRRDTPGKSPMGMDLIPIYEARPRTREEHSGVIHIDSRVMSNLGVRTEIARKKSLNEKIRAVGYIKFNENTLIHIHPRVSGWIEKLYVKAPGNSVKQGEALYSLYSPELVNAQEELILALNQNDNQLINSAENRLEALQIPASFIRKIKRNKRVSQAITFYSPQAGVVDNLNVREGFYVQPGNNLFSIGSLETVWVEAEIFERQSSRVQKGAMVTMTLDYLPGQSWEGEVDYVYPILDRDTRTLRVRIEFKNSDQKLLPNMFAQVLIYPRSDEERLLVHREAVIRTENQNRVVLALGEGRFKSVKITTGVEVQDYIEVLSGLKEGDEIVSSAQFLIDSESSKTSDFMRMDTKRKPEKVLLERVWVAAVIDERLDDQRSVIAKHQAIKDWGMRAMTMKFRVAESVDFGQLKPGTRVHMQIKRGDTGQLEIVATHIKTDSANSLGDIKKPKEQTNTPHQNHSMPNHRKD